MGVTVSLRQQGYSDYVVLFTPRQIERKTETNWKNGPKSTNEGKETNLEGKKKQLKYAQ